MAGLNFTSEQRAKVTEAVAAAELATDGEIVTIVSDRSDAYHDVGLHYAVGTMLALFAVYGVFPGLLEAQLAWFHGGWIAETELPQAMLALFVGQAILFLIVRYALAWWPLRMALTPPLTKSRRVRRRALQFFKSSAEKRTRNRVGILLYVSLSEHRAEIIADQAIHSKTSPECWGDAMAVLVEGFRNGNPADGMAGAVGKIALVLAEHFPKTGDDINELPDRLIEL